MYARMWVCVYAWIRRRACVRVGDGAGVGADVGANFSAARMEQTGRPGHVHMTAAAAAQVLLTLPCLH